MADEICRLREMKQSALVENADRQTKRKHVAEMTEFLNSQSVVIGQYDDKLVRRLVERVTVYGGKVVVRVKAGMEEEITISL